MLTAPEQQPHTAAPSHVTSSELAVQLADDACPAEKMLQPDTSTPQAYGVPVQANWTTIWVPQAFTWPLRHTWLTASHTTCAVTPLRQPQVPVAPLKVTCSVVGTG